MSSQVDNEVRIADLRDPALSAAEVAFISALPEVSLTVDSVLREASRLTGLTDFGPDDFRERLGSLLAECDALETLNRFGRMRCWQEQVRYMANRLCQIDLYKRHPEIDDMVIDRPIIVAGMPRSGTSHMVNIIAADRRLRSMPLWESLEPIPWPAEAASGVDQRRQRCHEGWGIVERMQPYMSLMHEMGPDYVHEDNELMGANCGNYMPEFHAYLRGWQDRLFTEDQRPNHRFAKQGLKTMTWLKGPNRWVTKSPSHMENLAVLHDVYPDATLAVLHRDPVAVLQSLMTMMAYADRLRRNPVDVHMVRDFWADRVERALRACVAQRDSLPEERIVDIMFHDYMADPMKVIAHVYSRAELPLTAEAMADLDRYILANPRGKHGRLVHDPIGDFDLDVRATRERFRFYYERFPVQIERVLGEAA